MNNPIFPILGFIAILIILLGFIIYSINTNKIIREQEKEIARLKTTIKRYEHKEPLYIVQDGRKPKFGDF